MSVLKRATPIAPNETVDEQADTLLVSSALLGTLPVRRADLLAVPAGLYGFESCTSFALVAAGRDGLWWLQSTERAELAFLLADPFQFFPGHEVDVPDAELAHLDATPNSVLMALVIVTLPARPGEPATANLRAPLVIDAARRIVRQVVLPDETLSLTAPIDISA